MSEIRPTSREHVHHAVVYIRPPGSAWLAHAPIGTPFTDVSMADSMTKSDLLLVYARAVRPNSGRWHGELIPRVPISSSRCTTRQTANPRRTRQHRDGLHKHATDKARHDAAADHSTSGFRPAIRPIVWKRAHNSERCPAAQLFPHLHLRGKEFEYNIVHPESGGNTRLSRC